MSKKDWKPGEGDREADRQYRDQAREFVKSGKVKEAAEKAREQDPAEGEEAEKKGRSRAKELDPEVHREHDQPVKSTGRSN